MDLTPSAAILRAVERAVRGFAMLPDGATVAVGLSGGKDSFLLHAALRALQRREDLRFTLRAVHLDQQQPGFDRATFEASLARQGIDCAVVTADTWAVVRDRTAPDQIPCAVCSRMRRGILNTWCAANGVTHLALGHHLDDAIETFFMNLLFGRRLEPMKPVTPSTGGVDTIRPLILVEESKVLGWVRAHDVGVVACPVCDTYPRSQRREIGAVLETLRARYPGIDESVRAALYEAAAR